MQDFYSDFTERVHIFYLHLTVEVPIYTQEGCEKKTIEEKTSRQIHEKLSKYANEIAGIDRQMMRLRRQIENS